MEKFCNIADSHIAVEIDKNYMNQLQYDAAMRQKIKKERKWANYMKKIA